MKIAMGCLSILLAVSAALTACADSGASNEDEVEKGTLALPLTSTSPAGIQYRLRNASFEIQQPYYYCDDYGVAGQSGVAGAGGGCAEPVYLNSESDPNATSLSVELEQGSYEVYLQPGWSMERIENGVATPVEAQLLSSQSQWVYVSRHSTYWVNYQFGIGDHAIWFNGKLNIEVQVYDNPDQYYGPSYGGTAGFGNFPVAGMPAMAGAGSFGGASYL